MIQVRDILLMVLALMVQPAVASQLSFGGVRPDLVLLVLVFVAISRGRLEGALLGFGAGYFQDVYAATPLGFNALVKCLVGYAAGAAHGEVATETVGVRAAIVFAAMVTHDLLYHLFSPSAGASEALALLLRSGLPSAAYTAAFALLVPALLSLVASRAVGTGTRGWLRR